MRVKCATLACTAGGSAGRAAGEGFHRIAGSEERSEANTFATDFNDHYESNRCSEARLRGDCDSRRNASGAQRRNDGADYAGSGDELYRFGEWNAVPHRRDTDADALGLSGPAAETHTPPTFSERWSGSVEDGVRPEIPVNIVDLGLIYSLTLPTTSRAGRRSTWRCR